MVNGVGEAGEFIFKALWGVVDGHAKVNSSYFDVPDHPAAVVPVEIVYSNEVIVFNGVCGDAACKFTEDTFFFQQEETIIFGNVRCVFLRICGLGT